MKKKKAAAPPRRKAQSKKKKTAGKKSTPKKAAPKKAAPKKAKSKKAAPKKAAPKKVKSKKAAPKKAAAAKAAPSRKQVRSALHPSVQQKILEILLHKQAILAGNVSRLENGAFKQGRISVSVDNMADHGTDSYDQEFNLGLVESHEMTLVEINEAIKRIRSGEYGLCEDCGAAIPKLRLQAIPYTRVCIDCQSKREGS